ncbi:MAG: hypothetical protein A2167_03960 [Planctomycetes bacterium RBG_13_46_10]|nr:MAG: hypothetical protein A2167_03960 [Planctomycetes bacterium RBG_13_46_10]
MGSCSNNNAVSVRPGVEIYCPQEQGLLNVAYSFVQQNSQWTFHFTMIDITYDKDNRNSMVKNFYG